MLQTPNNIKAVTARDLRNNFKKIAMTLMTMILQLSLLVLKTKTS